MRRFLSILLLTVATVALADPITFDREINRKMIGNDPGAIADKLLRSGHPFSGMPSNPLLGLSELSGVQWYSDEFVVWPGPLTGAACAGGWQVADTGTGVVGALSIAGALVTDGYGALSVASGGTEDNCTVVMLCGEPFKYVVGKQLWMFAKIKVSDADDQEATWGLLPASAVATDTTAELIALDDGLFFEKAETSTAFDFHARQNDASTESTSVSTVADSTYRVQGIYVDPAGNIEIWEGASIGTLTQVGTIATGNANIPDDVALTLYFAAEAGSTGADSIIVDWVVVAQEE